MTKELRRLLQEHSRATVVSNGPTSLAQRSGELFYEAGGIPGNTLDLTNSLAMAANAVAIKLGSLRDPHRRYVEHLQKRSRQLQETDQIATLSQRNVRLCELEMLYEVDAFFHQFKSTLDMLVKLLCVVFATTPGRRL